MVLQLSIYDSNRARDGGQKKFGEPVHVIKSLTVVNLTATQRQTHRPVIRIQDLLRTSGGLYKKGEKTGGDHLTLNLVLWKRRQLGHLCLRKVGKKN